MNSVNRPRFVYFDLGNVLCLFDHEISTRNMAKAFGVEPKLIRSIVYESDLEFRYEIGEVTSEEFVEEIISALHKSNVRFDASPTSDKVLHAASDMFRPNVSILPCLQAVAESGIPFGILSNTNQAHWEWIARQQYPTLAFPFAPIVLSYEIEQMKPSPAIYQAATNLCGFEPWEIFFIDDRADNIEAANVFGWKTYQYGLAEELLGIIQGWL
jgi:glucose-1-phosphatase